jgi:hypothetical protein
MPHLLALCNGTYKAALGIRSGEGDLFIEQYISGVIEQQPVFVENNITRKDIVEIGHLFSKQPTIYNSVIYDHSRIIILYEL